MIKRHVIPICLALTGLCFVPVCRAQNTLPDSLIGQSSLSDADRTRIREYAQEHVRQLDADNSVDVAAARRALVSPLGSSQVKVPFRLEYSSDLAGPLTDLAKSERDVVAINAIYVAGDLATRQGADIALGGLADKRRAVRYAAVVAMEHTFEAANPALSIGDAQRIFPRMGDSLRKETDPLVIDAYVRALGAAADPQRCSIDGARPLAVSALASGMSVRVRAEDGKKPAPIATAMLRAAETLRTEMIRVQPSLSTQAARDAAGYGGQVLAYVDRRLQAGDVAAGERKDLSRAALLGEQIVNFAVKPVGSARKPPTGLPDMITAEKDAEYHTEVAEVIGPRGLLTSPPFGYPADAFVKSGG